MNKKGAGEVGLKKVVLLILIILAIVGTILILEGFDILNKLGILPDLNVTQPSDVTCKYDNCMLMGGTCMSAEELKSNEEYLSIGRTPRIEGCSIEQYCAIKIDGQNDRGLKITKFTKEVTFIDVLLGHNSKETKDFLKIPQPITIIPGVVGKEKIDIEIKYGEKSFCYMLTNNYEPIIQGKVTNELRISKEYSLTNTPEATTLALIAWDPYDRITTSQAVRINSVRLDDPYSIIRIGTEMKNTEYVYAITDEEYGYYIKETVEVIRESGETDQGIFLLFSIMEEFYSSGNYPREFLTDWKVEVLEYDGEPIFRIFVLVPKDDENYKMLGADVSRAKWVKIIEMDLEEALMIRADEKFTEFIKEKIPRGGIWIDEKFS